MEIYRVGGSVRDELLGLPVHDTDWVVVGATPEQMIAQGFQPVGKDFPVFLHPDTHEEYALARTERKTGPGYKGFAVHFAPDVTLEEDLARRDLTINAMAVGTGGAVIDPYGGQQDLADRKFRHVSDAFAEDPVRILRLARFAARFPSFSVANTTLTMMRNMAANGEVDALVPERVWQELARGLMEKDPARMFEVLHQAQALGRLMPAIDGPNADPAALPHLQAALQRAATDALALPARFGLLALANDQRNDPPGHAAKENAGARLAAALRAPNDCRDIARLLVMHRTALFDEFKPLSPEPEQLASDLLEWIARFDGLRRPERLPLIMASANAWSNGGHIDLKQALETAVNAAQSIDAGAIARPLAKAGPEAIATALNDARHDAIERRLTR